jgi:hypothetical protein
VAIPVYWEITVERPADSRLHGQLSGLVTLWVEQWIVSPVAHVTITQFEVIKLSREIIGVDSLAGK